MASARSSEATATLRVMPLSAAPLRLRVGVSPSCRESYTGTVLGLSAATVVDSVHLGSAALVGFARGLNDSPKILGLLLASTLLSPPRGLVLITIAMTVGGLVAGRRVLETLARRVTTMNAGQGLSANLVASFLVAAGARYGWPLSTTHVVTGGLFGIGIAQGKLRGDTVRAILMAWAGTLPLAAALGATFALALRR
jgi:PiT family inorganic phosphate transporter